MRVHLLCLLAALHLGACAAEPAGSSASDQSPVWSIERVETAGGLASVWGSGPRDVWAAGGQQGRGLILHNDGGGWVPADTGFHPFVWWVYGVGARDVYAVGEQGLILHFDGTSWTTVASGTTTTLYGLWGRSADDIWVVGGDPSGQAGKAVILRGNASGFHPVTLPPDLVPGAIFKVYGMPAGDVVAVGTGGSVLRFDGTWRRDTVPTKASLISLWGGGGETLYAVGGDGSGIILHYDGAVWSKVSGVGAGMGLFGVFKSPGQPAFAVGAGPRILQVDSAQVSEPESPTLNPGMVLHSVWGDGLGSVYAVGGSLYGDPTAMTGVILRRQ